MAGTGASATMAATSGAAATMAATDAGMAGMDMSATMEGTMEAPVAMAPAMAAEGCVFVALLQGTREVPAGDTDGVGYASVLIVPNRNQVCYQLDVANIKLPATAAHIHSGAEGQAGRGDSIQPSA